MYSADVYIARHVLLAPNKNYPMHLFRTKRVLVALITLVSALFTQLAIAGYICPEKQLSQAVNMAAAVSASDEGNAMPNCDVVDPDQTNLCKAHSEGTEPLFDRTSASGAMPALAPFSIGSVILISAPVSKVAVPLAQPSLLVRQSEPPVSIRNCCFRI